jgi:hypothetical protein
LTVFVKEWCHFFTAVAVFALSSEEGVKEGGIDGSLGIWGLESKRPLRFKIQLNKLKRHQRI